MVVSGDELDAGTTCIGRVCQLRMQQLQAAALLLVMAVMFHVCGHLCGCCQPQMKCLTISAQHLIVLLT